MQQMGTNSRVPAMMTDWPLGSGTRRLPRLKGRRIEAPYD